MALRHRRRIIYGRCSPIIIVRSADTRNYDDEIDDQPCVYPTRAQPSGRVSSRCTRQIRFSRGGSDNDFSFLDSPPFQRLFFKLLVPPVPAIPEKRNHRWRHGYNNDIMSSTYVIRKNLSVICTGRGREVSRQTPKFMLSIEHRLIVVEKFPGWLFLYLFLSFAFLLFFFYVIRNIKDLACICGSINLHLIFPYQKNRRINNISVQRNFYYKQIDSVLIEAIHSWEVTQQVQVILHILN